MDLAEDSPVRSSLLCKVLEDPKHMGFSRVEDAAYLCLALVIGAADTVGKLFSTPQHSALTSKIRAGCRLGLSSRQC